MFEGMRPRLDIIDGTPFLVYPNGMSWEADPRDPAIAAGMAEIRQRSAAEKRKIRLGGCPGHFELIDSVEMLEKSLIDFE